MREEEWKPNTLRPSNGGRRSYLTRDTKRGHYDREWWWWSKTLGSLIFPINSMPFGWALTLFEKCSQTIRCNWKSWTGKASRLARPGVGARSIWRESTTCLRSKSAWDLSPDGRQLCEPKMMPTIIFNHYFLSSLGFQFNHAIEKHKKNQVWCGILF